MESKALNILYITHKPIFPVVDGGCKAMAQFLDLLASNKYKIHHFTLATEKHPFTKEAYPPELPIAAHTISTKLRPIGALGALLKGKSYHLSRFYHQSAEEQLADFIKNKSFDIVLFESLFTLPYVHFLRTQTKAKMIVRAHNVEHLIWEKIANNSPSVLRSTLLKQMIKALKREEIRLLSSLDGILAISKVDEFAFSKIASSVRRTTIPINIPVSKTRTNFSSSTFFHLGSMNWAPNIEAVDILVNNLFPEILKASPTVKLVLAGSHMENSRYENRTNIEIIGFVERLDSLYDSVGILLSPIQSGSGVRVKILEAMSKGIPVITSPQGAEGIDENEGVFIAKDDAEFISKAIELQQNEPLRRKMGLAGQEFILQNYSIESLSLKLDAFLRSI